MEEIAEIYRCAGYFTTLSGGKFHLKHCRCLKYSCILITKGIAASKAFTPCTECIDEFGVLPDMEEQSNKERDAYYGFISCVGFYTVGHDNLFHGKSCENLSRHKRKITDMMAATVFFTPCPKCLPETAKLWNEAMEKGAFVDFPETLEKFVRKNDLCFLGYKETNYLSRGREFIRTLKEYNGR